MIISNSVSTAGLYRQYDSNVSTANSQSGDYGNNATEETGVKINISESVRGNIPDLSTGTVSRQNDISFIQATSSSLDSMVEIIGRMNALSAKTLEAGVDASERVSIDSEMSKLKQQLRHAQDEARASIGKVSELEMPDESAFESAESISELRDQFSSLETSLVEELTTSKTDAQVEEASFAKSLGNILREAASSIMAQANQTNQGVLTLLN